MKDQMYTIRMPAPNFCVDRPNKNGVIIDGVEYFKKLEDAIDGGKLHVYSNSLERIPENIVGRIDGFTHSNSGEGSLELYVAPIGNEFNLSEYGVSSRFYGTFEDGVATVHSFDCFHLVPLEGN